MPPQLDVVVPAHNEQSLVGACLRALLSDADGLDLRVVVVANGCTDDTAGAVRTVVAAARAARPQVQLLLVETRTAGKAAALNLADRYRRGCAVVYLDADMVITPGSLSALAAALVATAEPRMVMPRPLLVRPRDRLGRHFAAVWSRLPAVAGQVIGGGCYAVNPAGRARWSAMPRLWADDAFVRSRFAAGERQVIETAGMLLPLPQGRELVRVLSRWRRGNAALADSPGAGTAANLATVLARPSLWPFLPGFLLVSLAARGVRQRRWPRADRLRAHPGSASDRLPLRVDAVILDRPGPVAGSGRLASLRSGWAELTVVTARCVRGGLVLDRAGPPGGDYLLLVGAGVEPVGDALDELLALALRFPDAGLYGGVPVGRPGTRRAGWYVVREVRWPAAGLLLISRWVWHRLAGPPYPLGADLVRQARLSGSHPMCTTTAEYRDRPRSASVS